MQDLARASITLLDQGGLRALTVRAVAGRLGTAPASLYSRVTSLDDLYDLALDDALGQDHDVQHALTTSDLHGLMIALYRHLVRHPWTCQVIGMRAPRGPSYLRLSERMCQLLDEQGAPDPLGTAYALSNFVIGSATTAPAVGSERATPIDPSAAPLYAHLHAEHTTTPEQIVAAGLTVLEAIPAPKPR